MFGFSRAFSAAALASSTICFSDASSNCRVDAEPARVPLYTVTLTWRSNCTMFAVMFEFAKRVAERSPPLKSTSTASAFAMLRILSVSALTSSREYIGALLLDTCDVRRATRHEGYYASAVDGNSEHARAAS